MNPIWNNIVKVINDKEDANFTISNFKKMFGILDIFIFVY